MDQKTFTIKDLERFSGIRMQTLRVWEQRYNLLKPMRTQSNIRKYSIEELQKILNVSLLNRNGYRVSALAEFTNTEINSKIKDITGDANLWEHALHKLIINMYSTDPTAFEVILDDLLITWGTEVLVEKIIFPFLTLTRLLWVGNKLYEEHLVVTALRKKLMFAIETIHISNVKNKMVLLFLPDSKQLDLGLLYSYYYFKIRGVSVLYLGMDVTVSNLKIILQMQPPEYMFTYLPKGHHLPSEELLEFINESKFFVKLVTGNYNSTTSSKSNKHINLPFTEALDYIHSNIIRA